jgi:hypothetical protein
MSSPPDSPARVWRGRLILIGLFALFLGTVVGAGVLRFSGWQPQGSKVHGQIFEPAVDARAIVPRLAGGGDYAWNPSARTWRIVVAPPADCGARCDTLARDLDKVWRLFGPHADRVEILWIGTPPDAARATPALRVLQADTPLRAVLPGADDPAGVPVYVIDPNGFVILRYAPGADPGWIRTDVAKLLKLI